MERTVGHLEKRPEKGLKRERAMITILQSWLFNRWAVSRLNCRDCGQQV
jgi:hypothetical protein